jgi:integrase/recombinase XerC
MGKEIRAMSEIIPFRGGDRAPAIVEIDPYGLFLADARNELTRKGRMQDLRCLGRFLGGLTPEDTVRYFISGTAVHASATALAWSCQMQRDGLSPATINRRLSTLRRLCKVCRRYKLITWGIEVDSLRHEPYRDTAGPGPSAMKALIEHARPASTIKGIRDWALVALLYSAGLRRAEAAALDLVDVDIDGCKVRVIGKGRTEPRWLPMSSSAAAAIAGWLRVRPPGSQPLFVRLGRAAGNPPGRLSAHGIHDALRQLGRAAALQKPLAPHQLRHAAITRLAHRTNGNYTLIKEFSRHKSVETVAVYVRQALGAGAELAELLGEDLSPPLEG